MTTKTIATYLEDERRKRSDTELRLAEEAARIQPLRHGRHRTAKQPKPESPSPVGAGAKRKITAATARKKPRAARKTATKPRKMA